MKKFTILISFILVFTLISSTVAFAQDTQPNNTQITEDEMIELEVDIYSSMEEYQQSIAEAEADILQTRVFVEEGVFKVSLVRNSSTSTAVTTYLNFVGGNVVVDEVKFKLVKVTYDSNLGTPVYMTVGTGLSDMYLPMYSGETVLGIATIPTDQTKARFSAIGLAGHCVYHDEFHSINNLGSGGITIQ